MGLAAAVIGAGAIGGVASIASGAMNSSAVNSASQAQVQQDQSALALQQQEYNQGQANLAPYMTAGTNALSQYGNLSGANGNSAQQTAISGLSSNPLYTSLVGQGNQAILANASATGGLRSGNTNYNLANFDANALATTYQSQLGSLGTLAGMGQNSATGASSLGANYANSAAQTYSNIGSAQAGGTIGSTGALTSGLNSGLSSILGGISSAQYLGGFGGGATTGGSSSALSNASLDSALANLGI